MSIENWTLKLLEESHTMYVDAVYENLFGTDIKIDRSMYSTASEITTLFDRKFAIDTKIKFPSLSILTLQEKVLQFEKSKYNQLTLEYYNNTANSNICGDWFHFYAQLYFFGYYNQDKTGLLNWWVLDVSRLMIFLNVEIGIDNLVQHYFHRNPPPALSNFFAIPFDIIEKANGIILYKS